MTVSTFHSYPFTKLSFHPNPFFARAFKAKTSAKTPSCGTALTTPARDRVIDFGRHKGKMLGALPSAYLKWVSKNLRARDFEEWARLADQVLQDPIYQDRIEWEFAENILSGNRPTPSARNESSGVVSELLEISERFGWDNKDKSGWKNINFELLGTSRGGRIPRINIKGGGQRSELKTETETEKVDAVSEDDGRRRERRDRLRMKREASRMKSETKRVAGKSGGKIEDEVNKAEMDEIKVSGGGNMLDTRRNPFPGRETLLQNVLNRRRK